GMVPNRPFAPREQPTPMQIAALDSTDDLGDRELLSIVTELNVRGVLDPSVAAHVLDQLGPEGLDALLRRIAIATDEQIELSNHDYLDDDSGLDRNELRDNGITFAAAWEQQGDPARMLMEAVATLGALASTAPNPPAWLLDVVVPSDPTDSDFIKMALLLSAGRWHADVLEAAWASMAANTDELALANDWLPGDRGNIAGQPDYAHIYADLTDLPSMVLEAIGRNPDAAWRFLAGTWSGPSPTVLFDDRTFRETFMDTYTQTHTDWRIGSRQDAGAAAVIRGGEAHLNSLPPFTRQRAIDESWPAMFRDLMTDVGKFGSPGDETRQSLAGLTNWYWPALSTIRPGGDQLADEFFADLVRNDEALALLALGLGGYTVPITQQAAAAIATGEPVSSDRVALANAWDHLFAGLTEAGRDEPEQFAIISSALKTLIAYGVKSGTKVVGLSGGLPGVIITWGAGTLTSALVDAIVEDDETAATSAADIFVDAFRPQGNVETPAGSLVARAGDLDIALAQAILAARPDLVAEVSPSRWIVDGELVAPADGGDDGAFSAWLQDLTRGTGGAWSDEGAAAIFEDLHATSAATIRNEVIAVIIDDL
ncbi:MAG: hypothetical protein OEU32_12690, partial [Acidimicrobiia bacterium]|nr:hypothetical protein [Acidimicrobiia bacterium]